MPIFFCHSKPTFVSFIQSLKRPNATRQRLLKYLVPAILLSLAFNVPKFFEATVVYDDDDGDDTGGGGNGTEEDSRPAPRIGVTDMRKSPAYSAYNNWSRFILLGLLPFALLVFFNAMIYRCQVSQIRNVFSLDDFTLFLSQRHQGPPDPPPEEGEPGRGLPEQPAPRQVADAHTEHQAGGIQGGIP